MLKPAPLPTHDGLCPDHFRVLCAWCSTEIRAARIRLPHMPPPESHGICVPCAVRLGMPLELYERQVA